MNLQQLEYIIAVDQYKSFSKAAHQCGVTQATLSTMVKKLEAELKATIFDRKSNPIVTTECGKDIIVQSRRVLYESRQLRETAIQAPQRVDGELSLGIIPTIANALLPIILKPILERYPNLRLKVTEAPTDGILQQLKTGALDAGILATPLGNANEFEDEVLYYEALLVYGSIAEHKKYLIPEDIKKEQRVWMFQEGHCLREQFINLCSLQPKNQLPSNLEFEPNSFDTLINMVDQFGGLTLLPELYCKKLPAPMQKKIAHFQPPLPVREVSMVLYRPFAKFRLTRAVTQLIQQQMEPHLLSSQFKNSELEIVTI